MKLSTPGAPDSSRRSRQANPSEYHALSNRIGLYAPQTFRRTNGNTPCTAGSGHRFTATATIGDGFRSTPSSSRSQFAAGVGIVHRV